MKMHELLATKYKGKLLAVYADKSMPEAEQIFEFFLVAPGALPQVRIIRVDAEKQTILKYQPVDQTSVGESTL